jgi:hypothetical protein
VREFEDFEVGGVLKKESSFNGQKLSIRSARSFAQSKKGSSGAIARLCYQ